MEPQSEEEWWWDDGEGSETFGAVLTRTLPTGAYW